MEINPQEAVSRYLALHSYAAFNPEAALIDMDGTLLDSMKWHTLAWHRMMTEIGVPCTRDEFYLYEGMTGAETINMLFRRHFGRDATPEEKTGLYARKTGYFNEMPRVGIVPGAERVIECLIAHSVKRVLVTGSGQLSNLERLKTDFPGGFSDDMRITSRDVVQCKPHPEPYLRGMALAGVRPFEAIVLENAPLGVESGARAGAFVIAVTTGPVPEQAMWDAGADMVFPSMNDVADTLPLLLRKWNAPESK